MAKENDKFQMLSLSVVAVVALVAIVGVAAIVLNKAAVASSPAAANLELPQVSEQNAAGQADFRYKVVKLGRCEGSDTCKDQYDATDCMAAGCIWNANGLPTD